MAAGQCGGREDTAGRLHDWASGQMRFSPQGAFQGAPPPTPDDLKRICRGAHQADIWNYVMEHVHSVQTVKKVQGNLKLQKQKCSSSQRSDGRHDNQRPLLEMRARLQGEVTSAAAQTQQLEVEVARLRSDVMQAETEYQRDLEALMDCGRRSTLLRVFSQTSDNFSASVHAFSDRVDTQHDTALKGMEGVDTALHTRQDEEESGQGGTAAVRLETSTARAVRQASESIGAFLHHTLQGTFSKDAHNFNSNKDQLWKQVENTLHEHNIHAVVASLVQQSQLGAQALREHTAKVNIQQDAQKLKFRYERGGVCDLEESPSVSVLHSIQQLLEGLQTQHVLRFVETKRHHNTARPSMQQLEATRRQLDAQLAQYLLDHPTSLSKARVLVETQLELAGERAARDGYRREGEALREALRRALAQRDQMLSLHASIQDFQTLANARQSLIQVVAKQNVGARTRLAAQQLEVSQYVDRSIARHDAHTASAARDLRGSVKQEVDVFTSLSLPFLAYIYLDSETKVSLLDLSVNHTGHPSATGLRQALQTALAHLNFPPYKAAECLLPHVSQLGQDAAAERRRVRVLREQCTAVLGQSRVAPTADLIAGVARLVTELCQRVTEQDKEEVSRLLPVLHKHLSRAARASTECLTVRSMMQAWWEQPAQHTTPWVKAEGMTFAQWLSKWNSAVTKVRELLDRRQV